MKYANQLLIVLFIFFITSLFAQQSTLQYFKENSKNSLNVFETSKENEVLFEGVKVRIGGDFAIQYQGLSQTNESTVLGDTLIELSSNFNLPTANLNLDVQLADGMRMHLRTYLSSRHHEESWVKGGYLQLDKLDFIKEGFLSGLMEIATIKVGMDEINYGDAHFRRSDNACAIFNPFVGNYIMDSFTTEPYGEITIQKNGILGLVGLSNGRLNQSPEAGDDGMVFYGKLGYDNQINDDLRLRLTGSIYSSSEDGTRDYLYAGDRAGARYYQVLEGVNDDIFLFRGPSDFEPRINPGFAYQTAIQINPFIKYQGLEVFGIYEMTSNGNDDIGGEYTQIGAELLYRFGENENMYLGGRYNDVTGTPSDNAEDISTNRINIGAGWFMTHNVLLKAEYVQQKYEDDGWNDTKYQGAQFDGVVVEAVISF